MSLVLQQTLRGLCYKTGWYYAVFWKLKRRNRMVLTWEDGHCEPAKPSAISNLNSVSTAMNLSQSHGVVGLQVGRIPLEHGATRQENFEDPIGLAFAKMSYHVYSLGEGIIGRVSFTNKHQWVFSSGDKAVPTDGNTSNKQNSRPQNEKYPAGWQNQFAAGIKTIAIIAVPQGVVQLGSTQVIAEDLNLVGNIKAMFGTLQSVPGAYLSDLVPEAQNGRVHAPHPIAMSIPVMTSMGPPSSNTAVPNLLRTSTSPAVLGSIAATSIGPVGSNHLSLGGVGRLPILTTSQKLHPQPQLTSSAGELGMQGTTVSQLSPLHKFGSHSLVHPSSAATRITSTRAGSTQMIPANSADPSRTGIIGRFALTTKSTSMAFPQRLNLESGSQSPMQNVVVHNGSNSQLPRSFSSKFCNSSIIMNPGKVTSSQVGVQAQSGASICFPKSGLSIRDSLVTDSVASTPSQESVLTSAVSSLGASPPPMNKPSSCDENQGQSQVGESLGQTGDLGGAVPGLSHSSSSGLPSHVETKPSCSYVWRPPESHFDFQISDLLQLTEHFENSDKLDFGDHLSFEKEGMVPKDAPSLFCADHVDDLQPVKAMFENSESCFRQLSGNPDCKDVISGVLDDFDDYIASLTGEHDKQSDGFSMLSSRFAAGDELSEALFPASKKVPQKARLEDSAQKQSFERLGIEVAGLSTTEACDKANKIMNFNATLEHLLQTGPAAHYVSEAKPEPLLEAVVAGVSAIRPMAQNSDSSLSCKLGLMSGAALPPDFLGKACESSTAGQVLQHEHAFPAMLTPPKAIHEADAPLKETTSNDLQGDRCGKNHGIEQVSHEGVNSREGADSKRSCQNATPLLAVKQEDTVKAGRKRARPGETGRPRPKDRQQIQDRVRELRDIIPNATKCSIDALLERTIKYVNFLQTVTQHAGKWKQSNKLQRKCNMVRSSSLKIEANGSSGNGPGPDSTESGASWAVELGGQGIDCPIIVENLNQPRQMLVEMLCEEKGIFLEIAQAIRGFGLTILKGVMEARHNKIWARFVVEAVQDVHRVEVLWSLMQLLQPNSRPSNITNQPCAWRTTH